ncbi:MAG: ImmA/IrrE family metallo-endopeptidase [Clostridium sp.]|nr:ImmA/IrrE family metallo-endopeptidase [Clostridium sp.]
MSKKELTNAIKVAEDIIKRFGITEPPVLAKEFAEIHGLSIVYVNFDKINPQYNKISGFIDIDTNKLYVNADESPKRQNFTIAHELGHFLLGHLNSSEYSVLYRNNELSDSPLEREANCFAANLLVPEKLLRKTLKDYPFITDNQLGNLFGVSEIVIKNRKKHLGVCC